MNETAKGYQHLQARKRTRDSNGSRKHGLQSRRESLGVSDPEAVSTILELRANVSPRTPKLSTQNGRYPQMGEMKWKDGGLFPDETT